MKIMYKYGMAIGLLFLLAGAGQAAAVRVSPSNVEAETLSEQNQRLEKAAAAWERNSEKYQKRLNRLEKKLKKRGLLQEEQSQDVWSDSKFRLGALLLLVAIGLAVVSIIISLGGLFSFIASLFALAGVVLIIWSLVENYG